MREYPQRLNRALAVGVAVLFLTQVQYEARAQEASHTASAAHAAMGHEGHGKPMPLPTDVNADVRVDFELLDRDGNVVRDEDFRGRWLLLGFGFTHCPHICPMMAFNMGGALAATQLPAAGVFVSVDTERDTPAVSDDYAASFGERMLGLGGSIEQINAVAKNFKVSYVVTKTQNTYTVQHTANIYLIGPDGELVDTFAVNTPAAELVAAMQ